MRGLDVLGADDVVSIPQVGTDYGGDPKTVAAVQAALVAKGYDLGSSGPNNDGVDGLYGSKTKAAVKKLQAAFGYSSSGTIDEGVIMALKVTPGKMPPSIAKGLAAVNAQVALDAATAAEHAQTPSDVQAPAAQLQAVADNAAPPLPPAVKQKVDIAVAKARAVTTPAQVRDAAAAVVSAAQDAHAAVKPSWVVTPAWSGGPSWWQIVAAVGGALAVGGLVVLGVKRVSK
jgi:peptidoglycan hydrolase-like protein with peptidoglycan-binding domain